LLGNANDQKKSFYIPFREATITLEKDFGKFKVYYFKLGRFVKYSDSKIIPAVANDSIKQSLDERDIALNFPGKLVLSINNLELDFFSNKDNISRNWIELIDLISRSEKFDNTVFLSFQGIINEKNNSKISIENDCFALKSRSVYRVDIAEYMPREDSNGRKIIRKNNADYGRIVLSTSGDNLLPLTKEDQIPILGKYDEIRVYFVSEHTKKKIHSHVDLEGHGENEAYIPSLCLKTTIGPSVAVIAGYLVFITGIAIIAIIPYLEIPSNSVIWALIGAVASTVGLWLSDK